MAETAVVSHAWGTGRSGCARPRPHTAGGRTLASLCQRAGAWVRHFTNNVICAQGHLAGKATALPPPPSA